MGSRPWRRKSVPPMPALIPISVLRGGGGNKDPQTAANQDNNNDYDNNNVVDCGPCGRNCIEDVSDIEEEKHLVSSGDESELERYRRNSLEVLDVRNTKIDVGTASISRDCQAPCATPPSSTTLIRPTRTQRHRKSERRRRLHHRRRSTITQQQQYNQQSEEEEVEKCGTKQPRVNPIFVWVRQEDTKIVDVKCEDYDKRNRILLTKTAHGWRAIPRTETLTTTLEEKSVKNHQNHHHKHEKSKSGPGRPPKNKKSRKRRETTESESHLTEPEVLVENPQPESPWSRVEEDIESHLPSHTITIPKRHRSRRTSDEPEENSKPSDIEEVISDNCVNSSETHARTPTPESALETLLAAAEIAFNNQIIESSNPEDCVKMDSDLINCDYNELDEEDDTNNFADVLDKLEQSLQSPEEKNLIPEEEEEEICPETPEAIFHEEEMEENFIVPEPEISEPEEVVEMSDLPELPELPEEKEEETNTIIPEDIEEPQAIEDDLQPTDLSIHSTNKLEVLNPPEMLEEQLQDDLQPTDLSIKKHSTLTIEPICRPPSQNSETIQSPQPSGIPAVPPSPDIIISKNSSNKASVFLESLLSTSPKIVSLNSEITITRNQKEPLDLGKGRKSASPTVSCSEEVKNIGEPTPKRCKMEDITLKNLLHAEDKKAEVTIKAVPMEKPKPVIPKDQSSRLLELLTTDTVPDPMTQLKQLLSDPHVNIPDPMLVPKDRLSHILAAPAKEIPRLLVTRPELRLPEALSHPNLMNDPDILVITMDQLHTILKKHQQPISLEETSSKPNKVVEPIKSVVSSKPVLQQQQQQQKSVNPKPKNQNPQPREVNHQAIANDYHRYIQNLQHQQQLMLQEAQIKHHQSQMMRKPSGLANDIDAATAASFNQMMWLPYLSQLEQAAHTTGNNTEFLKMLNAVFPNGTYPNPPDFVPPLFGGGRFLPNNLPLPQPMDYNLEMSMWQEAMLRSNKFPPTTSYRENSERKMNHQSSSQSSKHKFLSGGVSMLNGANPQRRNTQGTGFSSARTNPIMAEQQLIGMKNPFFRPNVQGIGTRPNIQVPSYNNHLPQMEKSNKKDPLIDKFNLSQLSLKNNPFFNPKEKKPQSSNFLQDITLTKIPGEPFKPIDLSNSNQPKLKVRTNLMAGGFSFGREEAEVGSTTEDALMQNLHEANSQNHHVWHPLFGK